MYNALKQSIEHRKYFTILIVYVRPKICAFCNMVQKTGNGNADFVNYFHRNGSDAKGMSKSIPSNLTDKFSRKYKYANLLFFQTNYARRLKLSTGGLQETHIFV